MLWNKIIQQNLNVRASEFLATTLSKDSLLKNKKIESTKSQTKRNKDSYISELEDKLSLFLGTKVYIQGSQKSGKINILYYSQEDLERLAEKIENI